MIPFSPPNIDQHIIDEVVRTLKSGWITTGPRTKAFEKRVAEYCGIESVLAVSSWTAGAELLLKWYGIKEGDEVLVPSYTYCATANIVIHCGAKPIMVDIGKDFCIDVEKVEEKITKKTKAIISVDIGGFPVDYQKINDLIRKKRELFRAESKRQEELGRILFISDAAHSFGAKYRDKTVGSLADFTVFSFHAVKNLTTAEGGAICITLPENFNNQEIYKELNIWTLHGQTKDALEKSKIGAWEYDVITAGYKCNMTDILAAIGLIEIERYSENIKRRKEIFDFYTSHFVTKNWAIVPEYLTNEKETSYHLYLLRIKGINVKTRNMIIDEIFNSGVSVNVHYKPLPLLSYYSSLGYALSDYPIAEELWQNEISLPVHLKLTDEDLLKVVSTVASAVELYL